MVWLIIDTAVLIGLACSAGLAIIAVGSLGVALVRARLA